MILIDHTLSTIELTTAVLYGGFILLLLLFGWDLLERYIRADKRMRKDAAYRVFFIMGVAMLGYAIYIIPASISDFFGVGFEQSGFVLVWIFPLRLMLILLMIIPIGIVCLIILLEGKKAKKLVVYGSAIVGAAGVIYMLIITLKVGADPSMRYSTLPPLLLVIFFGLSDFLGIIYILIVKLAPQKEVRNRVLLGTLGIVIAGIGAYFEFSGRASGTWNYAFGTIIGMIGFLLMRYFFLSIPSYDEFAWKGGMTEIHCIIAETGISLYYRAFEKLEAEDLKGDVTITATIPESENRPNTDLVAGGLVGIKGMLGEISGDRGKLEHIEIGKKSLIFKQGKTVLCLLLADENLGVYHSMLEELVVKIELDHPELANFNGDTRKIRIKPLVEEMVGF